MCVCVQVLYAKNKLHRKKKQNLNLPCRFPMSCMCVRILRVIPMNFYHSKHNKLKRFEHSLQISSWGRQSRIFGQSPHWIKWTITSNVIIQSGKIRRAALGRARTGSSGRSQVTRFSRYPFFFMHKDEVDEKSNEKKAQQQPSQPAETCVCEYFIRLSSIHIT